MDKKIKKIVAKFITDNGLTFKIGERNRHCTILAGFCDYLEIPNREASTIYMIIKKVRPDSASDELEKEFTKVFEYAYLNSYGLFWVSEEAKKEYIFEPLEDFPKK